MLGRCLASKKPLFAPVTTSLASPVSLCCFPGLSGGDAEEAALAETKETEEPAPPSDEEPPAEEGSVLPSGETQTSLKTNRRLRLAHRAEEWVGLKTQKTPRDAALAAKALRDAIL